ncbi:MAG: cytochrome C oxidase subunit IV family protein [Verrucomicrobiia bacterium]
MTHDAEHLKSHIRVYVGVFLALGVLTVLTVWASYLPISMAGHVFVALAIASVKAFLVAAFFMHLTSERPLVLRLLIATFAFFLAMILLLLLAMNDPIRLTQE